MGPKAGVFCHNGLGDGVNMLVLSNNLQLNGLEVHTYHNIIGSMQNWFPHLPIYPYPSLDELSKILSSYDWFFVVWNDSDEFVKRLILEGKRRFPEKVKVLYLYPSPNIVKGPYYADCLADPSASVAKNMRIVCEKVMHLPKLTKCNGFMVPDGLIFRKHPKRVIIHPTSASDSKNWDKQKYVKLALHLKNEGYQPIFIPGPKDMVHWCEVPDVMDFPTFDLLARFIYESGYFIGNDSGLGHLASALGIGTLSLFRRKASAKMWAPSFAKGIVITPSSLIPNIRGLRLRDQYWKKFITVNMVRRAFERLVQS